VVVTEPARAGLANDVRDALPNAIDIRLQRNDEPGRGITQRSGRSAHELFLAFLHAVVDVSPAQPAIRVVQSRRLQVKVSVGPIDTVSPLLVLHTRPPHSVTGTAASW
jgi:hypothetical protein